MVLQSSENISRWSGFLSTTHDEISEALAFLFGNFLDPSAKFLFREGFEAKGTENHGCRLRMMMLIGSEEGL